MSIRGRLILAFSCCLLLACLGISLLVFPIVRDSDEKGFQRLAVAQLDREIERIRTALMPGIKSTQYLASTEVVRTSRGKLSSYLETTEKTVLRYADHTAHEKNVYDEFLRIKKTHPHYDLIFMANDDGQYVQAPEGG
ncbi:MAG: hypothetical protein Q4F27_01770, partial [Desulfovibrionaceae bacterium]|nr:hypothetical protein [Desulfovibrionaceae bacterium]